MNPNEELKEFLRSRRARLQPDDVGLQSFPFRRRVTGLRREELAQLVGVSVDYYVRLEQGRTRNVSETVLGRVAEALRLDETERAHLFHLAKPTKERRRTESAQRVRPGILRLLESIDRTPAFVLGRRMDVLACNRLVCALLEDFDALPPQERNLARHMFLHEGVRALYATWESNARDTVEMLRMYAGRHPDDPKLSTLVGELSLKSEEFRQWWAAHDVRERTYGTKRLCHPIVGELTIAYETFQLPADPDQTFCIYTVEPDSPSEVALQRLVAMVSSEQQQPANIVALDFDRS
jgi:transcriptional regulator with XRE-family HTH domain